MLGRVVFIVKISLSIFLFFVLFLSEIKKVDAQSCPSKIVYDAYKCGDYSLDTGCSAPVYDYSSEIGCLYDSINNNCSSITGLCTSNDTCTKTAKPFGVGYFCKCSNSAIDCNNPPTGTPPPGGGGGGASCVAGTHPEKECRNSCDSGYKSSTGCTPDCTGSKVCCRKCVVDACTPPTDVTATRVYPTVIKVDWKPGDFTTTQSLYVGATKNAVNNNCPVAGTCAVKAEGLGKTIKTYTSDSVLVPGKTYYVKVVNDDGACTAGTSLSPYLASCLVSPASLSLKAGTTDSLITSVNSSSEITEVTYSSDNTGSATVTTPDTSYPYTTAVTGVSAGSAVVTSNVYFGATLACFNTGNVTVTAENSNPWWQVVDSDISTNGDLKSEVPSGFFDADGTGGYPGVPMYGGATDLTATNISSKGWFVNSASTGSKIYDSNFFKNQIPSDVVPTDASGGLDQTGAIFYGYEWFKYTGPTDFNIDSNLDLGNRKVILIVDNANLNINANINLTDGVGFFMAVSEKNIVVDPIVTSLEGLYVMDNLFKTGLGNTQLTVRGSVTAYGGIALERDLGVGANTDPAEIFTYAPDQILLFPAKLSARKMSWKEVAP